MSSHSGKAREIDLGEDFGDVVAKANGAQFTIGANGRIDGIPAAANDAAKSSAALQIGDIESTGKHEGEIYGGIYPVDNKPIWFLQAPRLMNHFEAAARAERQAGSLPTKAQGDYLTTLKDKGGAFTELFNRGDEFPAGFVWLATPLERRGNAWCQRLSGGFQNLNYHYYYDYDRSGSRFMDLPVLCVRR